MLRKKSNVLPDLEEECILYEWNTPITREFKWAGNYIIQLLLTEIWN